MKKFMLALVAALTMTASARAQVKVEEPEFIGQVVAVQSDSKGVLLAKENAVVKTKAAASMYIVGIGTVKSRLTLKGGKARVRMAKSAQTRLIVRAVDNKTDPVSIITVTKF